MRITATLALAAAALALLLPAANALAGTCRIDWHPQGKGLLAVLKDGRAYKNKAYLAHDDVVRLREEVLIASGDCVREVQQEQCSVRRTNAGQFQIHFGAKPLYADETHRKQRAAHKMMHQLVQIGFCSASVSLPAQSTASADNTVKRITTTQ